MDRRRALTLIAGMGLPLTGCLEGAPSDPSTGRSTTPPPTDERATTSSADPECEGAKRMDYLVDSVVYDTLAGFTLRITEDTVTKGEPIHVTLENATDSDQASGVKDKYDIQRQAGDNWHSIFWGDDANSQHEGWHDVGITHPPGEGFTWELPVTRNGLGREIDEGVGYLAVCNPLSPGMYRFVFWGLNSDQQQQNEDVGLGARFRVTTPE